MTLVSLLGCSNLLSTKHPLLMVLEGLPIFSDEGGELLLGTYWMETYKNSLL